MRLLQKCFSSTRVLSSTTRSFSTASKKPPLCVVDLRGAGWSILERLCVEEFLTQTKPKQSWLVIGAQEALEHRHVRLTSKAPLYIERSIIDFEDYNPSCAIVLDDSSQLNKELVKRDGVTCFEGRPFMGESVVLDHSSLVTTLIAQEDEEEYFSTAFMTEKLWKPTFDIMEEVRAKTPESATKASPLTMVLDTKSCSKGDNSGRLISYEDLGIVRLEDLGIESDPEDEKFTSNTLTLSQQPPNNLFLGEFLVGKIHADETTKSVRSLFHCDYEAENLEYLSDTKPLLRLELAYQSQAKLLEVLQVICRNQFEVTTMNPRDILRLMAQEKAGLQEWWDNRSSWKIVQEI